MSVRDLKATRRPPPPARVIAAAAQSIKVPKPPNWTETPRDREALAPPPPLETPATPTSSGIREIDSEFVDELDIDIELIEIEEPTRPSLLEAPQRPSKLEMIFDPRFAESDDDEF